MAVVAHDGLLVLEVLQLAGKSAMQAASFVSGYGKQKNLRFETPNNPHGLLDKMMALGGQTLTQTSMQ